MANKFTEHLDVPRRIFKVVRQDQQGSFHSVCKARDVSINYQLDKEVMSTVDISPIFAFVSLEAAYAFKHVTHFVLECVTNKIYSNNLEKVLPSVALATISPERLHDFWCINLDRDKFITYHTRRKSKDTLLVSSLTPIRVLTNAEILEELHG